MIKTTSHVLKTYDYKVYVTGPFHAGKTTLIHTLDPDAISIERELREEYRGAKVTTTTGFDLGRVMWVRKEQTHDGLIVPKNQFLREQTAYEGWLVKEIELRGVPGQLHFSYVRDSMRVNSDGVLFVVDASDPGRIGDALAILAETRAAQGDLPIEIVANKQDLPEAATPEQVALWLGVEKTTPMTAKDRASCKDALILLLKRIEQSAQTIGATVVDGGSV